MLLNLQAAPKTLTLMVHILTPSIPAKPSPLPAYAHLEHNNVLCVHKLCALFARRPIWTRRALFNHLPRPLQSLVALPDGARGVHVARGPLEGYLRPLRRRPAVSEVPERGLSGRDGALVVVEEEGGGTCGGDDTESREELGQGCNRCFQLRDVTDPLSMGIIDTDRIRKKCDVRTSPPYAHG